MAAHFFKQTDEMRASYAWRSSTPFSPQFYDFLDRQMVALIKQGTGLSPSPQLTMATNYEKETYQPGETSKLNFVIGIAGDIAHPISFCWRSRSGRQVSISDEVFDEADLECWLEGLTPEQYYEDLRLYGKKKPPFKIEKLPFELEVRDYHYTMHMYVTMQAPATYEEINQRLDSCLAAFNALADERASGRVKGPDLQGVHNWNITQIPDCRVQLYLDAASPEVLKKIVQELAKVAGITKVEMDLPE